MAGPSMMTILCLVLLGGLAAARRHRASEILEAGEQLGVAAGLESEVELEKRRDDMHQTWCISSSNSLNCPDGKILKVRTAFYNRRQMPGCEPPPGTDTNMLCEEKAKAIDLVGVLCDGHQGCSLPASMHTRCPQNPFTHMRVVYQCVEGVAAVREGDDKEAGMVATDDKEPDDSTTDSEIDSVQGPKTRFEASGCITPGVRLSCQPGETLKVRTAWFNRKVGEGCVPKATAPLQTCEADASAAVKKLCEANGPTNVCQVSGEDMAACPQNPFIQMRVLYYCLRQ